MKKISEQLKIDQALGPIDINTTRTGAWFPMTNYRSVLGIVTSDTVAATKGVTVQLYQAQDAAGTGAKALSDTVTKTAPTGGAKLTVQAESKSSLLDKGFTHVAVRVSTDAGAALNAAAILLRGDGRYGVTQP